MHPESHYTHVVASIEIFLGLIFAAVITGLIFQRFSRPRARMLFVRNPTISMYQGVPTLMIRIANVRLNAITNARAKLWLLRQEISEEGREYRRFRELALLQQESPAFVLSWSIFHPIDASSPLHGLTAADLEAVDATFILAISGTDETSSQEVRDRHYYGHEDIRWGHRFADIFENRENGDVVMNYFRFHEVEPE
jgi:inward rectifier potassium channel